ncbi:MAG: PP2C family protein-serine/threonine phosphatase, partial [Acidobacteriota bacterium]
RPEGGRTPELRDTPNGRVMVSFLPLRLMRFRPGPDGARAGPRPPAAAQSPKGGRSEARPPGAPQGPRLLEIALYLESASSVFSPLRHNLIVSILAALGLAAAMILIWVQFPRYVRGKQMEEQLELARKVQADLLPPSNAALGGLDFAAACVPAWQVGGDFYDVFTTNQDHVAIVLGDVAGKGLSAALLMSMLHGALRSMRWMETPADQEISWRQLNYLLSTRTAPERFASLFWGSYDREARIIRYVNAGHLPPLLMRRNSNGTCQISRLDKGGPILGVIPTATYHQGEIAVQPGDLLVLYSDGIVEAANASEEEFGEKRLCSIIQENCARPSSEILDEILKQVRAYIQEEEPRDDMTLVVARIN